jgi:hypothetical protein
VENRERLKHFGPPGGGPQNSVVTISAQSL